MSEATVTPNPEEKRSHGATTIGEAITSYATAQRLAAIAVTRGAPQNIILGFEDNADAAGEALTEAIIQYAQNVSTHALELARIPSPNQARNEKR